MTPKLRRLAQIAALTVALLAAAASPAAAKTPCWKTLINDWYDGRIDNVYPIACYRAALKNLPEDVQTYSSARDDISRALQQRIELGKKGSSKGGGHTTTPAGGPAGKGPTGKGPTGKGPAGKPRGRTPGGGPIGDAIRQIGPKNASSVPIPLIVLAGIALLLLAAGSAGFLARRLHARRLPPQPGGGAPPGPAQQ